MHSEIIPGLKPRPTWSSSQNTDDLNPCSTAQPDESAVTPPLPSQTRFTLDYKNWKRIIHSLWIGLFTVPIWLYQWCLSPFLPNSCRFYPSCSEYTKQAIHTHGPLPGLGLGVLRIGRCRPGCEGGIDPVPALKRDKK